MWPFCQQAFLKVYLEVIFIIANLTEEPFSCKTVTKGLEYQSLNLKTTDQDAIFDELEWECVGQ